MAVKQKIYIPTFISSVDYQPVRTLPHIYFYNGLKDSETYYIQHYPSGSTSYVVSTPIDQFPYFDNYDGLTPSTGSNSLLFYNETSVYGETPTGSLYSNFWNKYVSLLYNPKTRLINASAIIPLADYFNMELNDIVQWRGNYYHLRAINDYNLKDGTCNLQLLGPIIKDIPAQTFDCTFNFSSSFESGVGTTTTTIQPTTSTTLGPTTSTTTTSEVCLSCFMAGATSGSFTSGGLDYNFISYINTGSTSLYPILNVYSGNTNQAKLLLIGGGGGGGYDANVGDDAGGGGGAGQVVFVNNLSVSSGSYEITMGYGGAAATSGNKGGNGSPTIGFNYTADFGAGGGGATPNNDGRASVSGSGGGGTEGGTGGSGGQSSGGNSTAQSSGGGGGASSNGADGISGYGGNGGTGLTFTGLTDVTLSVGGGGGGGTSNGIDGTATNGGGNAGASATEGTGGGGGGATNNNPGKGGGGRFIITWRACGTPTTTTTNPPTSTTTLGLVAFTGCGRGSDEAHACADAANNRTLYSNYSNIGPNAIIYTNTSGTLLTGYNNVFIDGAVWDINPSTGVITNYSSNQC